MSTTPPVARPVADDERDLSRPARAHCPLTILNLASVARPETDEERDLRERIASLEDEIERVRAILARKSSDRANAEALFSGLS